MTVVLRSFFPVRDVRRKCGSVAQRPESPGGRRPRKRRRSRGGGRAAQAGRWFFMGGGARRRGGGPAAAGAGLALLQSADGDRGGSPDDAARGRKLPRRQVSCPARTRLRRISVQRAWRVFY